MEGKAIGKYIPPHKRGMGEVSTVTPAPPTESKFQKFLENRGSESSNIKSLTD